MRRTELIAVGELASLLPLLVWLIGGAVGLTAMTAGRNAISTWLRARPSPEPEALYASTPARNSWWRRLPRPVLVAVIAAWGLRTVLLCYSAPVSDEYLALRAASAPTVTQFFTTTDWAARWRILHDLTTGDRPLWGVSDLLWGRLVPSGGGAAYALSLLAALVAALSLTGAAWRLFGDETAELALVVASLSPLLLYYSTSAMSPALCTMWICLALFFLSSPQWRTAEWAAGGLCLGLAFGTHMGAGAAALGLALALGMSAVAAARDRGLSAREKARRCIVAPLVGAVSAVAPLAAIAAWAGSAGESYLGRLVHHENLGFANLGPHGLWLRHMFELDPILEIIVIIGALAVILGGTARRSFRTFVGAGVLVLAGLLAVSLRGAPTRAWVSVLAFAAAAVAAWLAGAFRTPIDNFKARTPDPSGDPPAAPITLRTLAFGVGFIAVLFTIWRPISAMPRLVFPTWPLLVLVLIGSAPKAVPASIRTWVAPLTAVGCVLVILATYSMIRLRSIPARSESFAAAHPGWQRLRFQDLWDFEDRMRAGGGLATRSNFDIEVVGGATHLYPVVLYEEEPYKVEFMADMVRDFDLGGVLSGDEIPWAEIFFKPRLAEPSQTSVATPSP